MEKAKSKHKSNKKELHPFYLYIKESEKKQKREYEQFLEHLSDTMAIPKDVIAGQAVISMLGNHSIRVCNYRSIEEYSMYEEMCKCQELFTKFGGHPMAAGLSLPEENVEVFRKRINEVCTLTEKDLQPKIRIDVPMPLDYITKDLVRQFSILAPFGKDNTKPVFADKNIRIKRMAVLGKNKNVLKMSLVTQNGLSISGIYFGDIEGFLCDVEKTYGTPRREKFSLLLFE